VIFYFDLAQWVRMLRLAWRDPHPAGRRRMLVRLLVFVPCVASFHALCFFLDGILFPGLRRVEVRTPVFLVGHARSGTTLLHRLLSRDAERFSSFRLYEMYFPSLLQKKVIRALAAFDRRRLGGFFERRVAAWEKKRYGATQDLHAMGLTQPEEDDFLFYWSCASGTWMLKLPAMGEIDFYHLDRAPERKRRRVQRFYADCIRRQLLLNGTDRTHLCKAPHFAGRVASLIESFPDARIVVTMRSPHETIPSLLKLVKVGYQLRGWDEPRTARSLGVLAEQSFHTYQHPLEVLAQHPGIRHAVVDYRELVAEPKHVVSEVYQALGIPLGPAYEKQLDEEQARARTHKSGHRYSLAEFGLDKDAIEQELAELFARYHWNEGSPARGD
jgi:omega-hydroxy-beta-dihydromenaquinone-9 sulfotransferase